MIVCPRQEYRREKIARSKRPSLKIRIALACRQSPQLRSLIERARSERNAVNIFKKWKARKSAGRKSNEDRPQQPKRRSEPMISGPLIPLSYSENSRPRILPEHQPEKKNPATEIDSQHSTTGEGCYRLTCGKQL